MSVPTLLDELAPALKARAIEGSSIHVVHGFGDLYGWNPDETQERLSERLADPALEVKTAARSVVLWRFPDGIRFFAAPATEGWSTSDQDCWRVGRVGDVDAAVGLVAEWLSGKPATKLTSRHDPPPWNRVS